MKLFIKQEYVSMWNGCPGHEWTNKWSVDTPIRHEIVNNDMLIGD